MAKLSRRVFLASSALAAGGWTLPLAAQEPVVRSLGEPRREPFDELDLPRYRRRSSHLGWETRGDKFVVVANTSQADADWTAARFEEAWGRFADFADHVTDIHRQPRFALGAVLIYVDKNSVDHRGEDPPESQPILPVLDRQTAIHLQVGEGQPDLEGQLSTLQQASVNAFMHAAGMDRRLPEWSRLGLAQYFGEGREGELQQPAGGAAPQNYWTLRRIAPDRLQPPPNEVATAQVAFLWEGLDALRAPQFLDALAQTIGDLSGRTERARPNGAFNRPAPGEDTALDELAAYSQDDFGGWLERPQDGHPKWKETADDSPREIEVAEQLERMAFMLKLAWRFGQRTLGGPLIRPKVRSFPAPEEADAPASAVTARTIPPTPADLLRMLGQLRAPWATLTPDHRVLLGNQVEQLKALLPAHDWRYSVEADEQNRWRLAFKRSGRPRLVAWLEEDAEQPRRPWIRVEEDPRAESGPRVQNGPG